MSKLRILLYKEWRDQRALVIGALLVCVLLIVSAKLLVGVRFDAEIRTRFVLPACYGVFAVLLATESIAREVHSGVERTLLRLPVSRELVWLAKALFVVLGSALGLLVLGLLEIVLRLAERAPALVVIEPLVLPVIAAVATASFVAACVLRRSLPAAFLGLLLVGLVPLTAYALPPLRLTEWVDLILCSWTPAGLSILGVPAFLLGSLFAFRVRRADALGLRRAARACAGAAIVLVPAFAGTARSSAWAFDIVPFSRTAEICSTSPSPDGRFLAVQAEQEWDPSSEWTPAPRPQHGFSRRMRWEVWILDRTTGRWSEIDGRFRMFFGPGTWDARGRLLTLSTDGAFGRGDFSLEHIDPASGAIANSRVLALDEVLASWYWRDTTRDERVLTWKAKGLGVRVPKSALLVPSPQPGIVFHEQDGFLVRHELDPDCTTRLAALGRPNEFRVLAPSPDGSLLFLYESQDDRCLLDACTGEVVRRFDAHEAPAGWSNLPGRIYWVLREDLGYCALNEDGSLTPLPAFDPSWQELGPDHLFHRDPQRIECMKLDGSERQVLYQARP